MAEQKYPVDVTVEYPETSDRILALSGLLFLFPKMLVLLPHLILLYILQILSGIVMIIGYIVVLVTGKYNRDLFNFQVGILRWNSRVNAYLIGLTDKYPPFRLEE